MKYRYVLRLDWLPRHIGTYFYLYLWIVISVCLSVCLSICLPLPPLLLSISLLALSISLPPRAKLNAKSHPLFLLPLVCLTMRNECILCIQCYISIYIHTYFLYHIFFNPSYIHCPTERNVIAHTGIRFYCIVLYCIVLYCIVLYCIVLYCIVLYCIVLYCPTWATC